MVTRKVMVVNEDAPTRTRCKEILVEGGFDVVEATDGTDAVSVYGEFQPDMVFMDITMPDMACLMALQEILVMDPKAKVSMSMVTGQQGTLMKAIKMGAVGFVIKPFCQEQVIGAVYRSLPHGFDSGLRSNSTPLQRK